MRKASEGRVQDDSQAPAWVPIESPRPGRVQRQLAEGRVREAGASSLVDNG